MLETKINPATAQEYFANKLAFTIGPVELDSMIREGEGDDIAIVDVRAAKDYERGHVPGAINLPRDQWHSLEGLRNDAVNILYCYTQTCHLAARAAHEFAGKGYQVMEMEGGFEAWQSSRLDVQN
jgi:rhodanese-related sulfurtransferase